MPAITELLNFGLPVTLVVLTVYGLWKGSTWVGNRLFGESGLLPVFIQKQIDTMAALETSSKRTTAVLGEIGGTLLDLSANTDAVRAWAIAHGHRVGRYDRMARVLMAAIGKIAGEVGADVRNEQAVLDEILGGAEPDIELGLPPAGRSSVLRRRPAGEGD